MHHRAAQRGFTVIELMIVVAIIAVLAAIVIPSFVKEGQRGKARSEVDPMFAELGTREEQYKTENNAYIAAAACPASVSTSGSGTDMTGAACATGTDWTALRVAPSQRYLRCSYTVVTGDGGVMPTTGWPTWAAAPPAAPATGWYFIKADCPSNVYVTTSWDSKIQSQDGH